MKPTVAIIEMAEQRGHLALGPAGGDRVGVAHPVVVRRQARVLEPRGQPAVVALG